MAASAAWALEGLRLDWALRRLPNGFQALGLGIGLTSLLLTQRACSGANPSSALCGMLLGLAILLPFWWIRWMGAGDVKLFAVVGLMGGAGVLIPTFLIGSLCAAAMAILLMASRQGWLIGVLPRGLMVRLVRESHRGLPFGAGLATGFCFCLLAGLGRTQGLLH